MAYSQTNMLLEISQHNVEYGFSLSIQNLIEEFLNSPNCSY